MSKKQSSDDLFCDFYAEWVKVYKEGAIRPITLSKYNMAHSWLKKLVPDLKLCDLDRIHYQEIINAYAETHERQTTMDFHHLIKGAILDAVDEGLIERDPTRKAIIKGKTPAPKKIKYLNQYELHTLLSGLNLKDTVNWDYFILLVSVALALGNWYSRDRLFGGRKAPQAIYFIIVGGLFLLHLLSGLCYFYLVLTGHGYYI